MYAMKSKNGRVVMQLDQRYLEAIESYQSRPRGDIYTVLTAATGHYIPSNPEALGTTCEHYHVQDHYEMEEILNDDELCVLSDDLDYDLGGNGPCIIGERRVYDQWYYLASKRFVAQSPLVRTKVSDGLSGSLSGSDGVSKDSNVSNDSNDDSNYPLGTPCEHYHAQDRYEMGENLNDNGLCVLSDGLDYDLGGNDPCIEGEHRVFGRLCYLASKQCVAQSPLVRTKGLDGLSGSLSDSDGDSNLSDSDGDSDDSNDPDDSSDSNDSDDSNDDSYGGSKEPMQTMAKRHTGREDVPGVGA